MASQGLYGPPPYKTPPTAGGIWGDFWNAVSAVVTTAAGPIASLVGEVWSLALADSTYFGGLWREAAALFGSLLQRVTEALVSVGRVIRSALNTLLDYTMSLVRQAIADVVQPLSSAFARALSGWSSSLFSAANQTVLAYQGTSGAQATAGARFGSVMVAPLLIATSIGVVIDVVLGIAAPLDIGASVVVGFVAPLIITLFKASLSTESPAGWPALLNSQLNPTSLASFGAFDSLSQWLVNQTQSINTTTVGAWIDPPGDFWSLLGVVAGAGAFVSGFVAVYEAQLKDPESDATGLSATAMVFALASLLSVIAEYLVSQNSSSYVAHAAEFGLSVVAATFGVMAIGSGTFAILSGGPDAAAFAGLIGVGLGGFGLWASYHDLDSLYAET